MVKLSREANKLLKRESRHYKREKRRCKKLYWDWKDDEFNMLADHFIFAVPADKNEEHFSFIIIGTIKSSLWK